MLLFSLTPMLTRCFIPAAVGSLVTTPINTITDYIAINTSHGKNFGSSLVSACRQCSLDEKSALAFGVTFSTLFANNVCVDESVGLATGTAVNTVLSMVKDSVYMGGSLTLKTRSLFLIKDVISIVPSISLPELGFVERMVLVFLSQIPCTLINSAALDNHYFPVSGTLRDRKRRIRRSFLANFPVRFLKSLLGSALAGHVNHTMVRFFVSPGPRG